MGYPTNSDFKNVISEIKTNTGFDSITVKFKAIIRIAEGKANTYPASIVNPNLYV